MSWGLDPTTPRLFPVSKPRVVSDVFYQRRLDPRKCRGRVTQIILKDQGLRDFGFDMKNIDLGPYILGGMLHDEPKVAYVQ